MSIRIVVAVTDREWFEVLRATPGLADINFWAPSDTSFKALTPGELFLFKLHAPDNFIVGGGIFSHANSMPCSLAWEAFGIANGARSLPEMRQRIARYRRSNPADRSDFVIGCRILSQPFFLDEVEWFPPPPSWSPNIVTFKTFTTGEVEGRRLWDAVQQRIVAHDVEFAEADTAERYGEPRLIRPRLGQGAFRIIVTDAYSRRCAVTREKTLPALDAAHIRPYSEGGEHRPNNGLLLRRDIHSLFDAGYVTVAPDGRFEVSRRIKEEFENGRDYYALHGRQIEMPREPSLRPDRAVLEWHNNELFRG